MPSLLAILGLDSGPFNRGLKQATASVKTVGREFASSFTHTIGEHLLGIASVSSIIALSERTVEWAAKLRDSADALGVNVEFMQKLQNGARLAGADIEDVTRTILDMNRSRQEAIQNPRGSNARAFARLGASPADINNLGTEDFFKKIIAAFKNGASTQLSNDVIEVGGKSARNLIAAFANQFASDTPILSEEVVNQLKEADDKLKSFSTSLKVYFAPVIVFIIGLLNDLVQWGERVAKFGEGFGSTFDPSKIWTAIKGAFTGNKSQTDELSKTFWDAILQGGREFDNEKERQKAADAAAAKARADAEEEKRNRAKLGPHFLPINVSNRLANIPLNANQKIGAQAFISPHQEQMLSTVKDIRKDVKTLKDTQVAQKNNQSSNGNTEF